MPEAGSAGGDGTSLAGPGATPAAVLTPGPGAWGLPPSLASALEAIAELSLLDRQLDSTSSSGDDSVMVSEGGSGVPPTPSETAKPLSEVPSSSSIAEPPSSSSRSSISSSWRPSQIEVQASPCWPVLVAAAPSCPYQRILSEHDPRSLPINDGSSVEFDTPLFRGRACVWIRGLPGAPEALFAGRRRRTLVTVQGRFRRPVPVDDLVTGQEFSSLENLPGRWLVEGVLLRVLRAVSPSMQVNITTAPSMLMPVIAGCSEMQCHLPGMEPDPAAAPREDLQVWDSSLVGPSGAPLPAAQRKAHFSNEANRAGRTFPTNLTFTFHFYQHVVDVSTYELDAVAYRFDLCKYLREPLQLMMRSKTTGDFAYVLHMWHERLLQATRG